MTHQINTVILDKTGTITNGAPVLTDVITDEDEAEFVSLVAAAEKKSEHPLAQAIVEGVQEKTIGLKDVSEFEAVADFGIKATVEGKEILVGTRRLMKEYSVDIEDILENGFLAPWLAGAAMAFSSVSVVLNALRLQRVKLPRLNRL